MAIHLKGRAMEIHNRDMFPSEETCALYQPIISLVRNTLVEQAFSARENAANLAKKRYHRLGRIGMLCIIGGALTTVAEALVLPPLPGLVTTGVAVVASIGLALQIFLFATKQKRQWLNNRFAAERLRSLKFQAFGLATMAADTAALAEAVKQFCTREIDLLKGEMNAAHSVLRTFAPSTALARLPGAQATVNAGLAAKAAEAYSQLRGQYQSQFAADEAEKLEGSLRFDYTVADMFYLSGATFTVAALVCKIPPLEKLLFLNTETWSHWIDLLAIISFILGLGKTLMDNASLGEESRSRYIDYREALDAARRQAFDLLGTIRGVEHAALEELHQFCRSANRISYRI